jgi:MYXO-CTERM domain-containing protein
VSLTGPSTLPVAAPQGSYVVGYSNSGVGTALDGALVLDLPAGVTVDDAGGGTVTGSTVTFTIGSIGASGTLLPPPAAGNRTVVLSFAGEGAYTLSAHLDYRVGVTALAAGPALLDVGVGETPPPGDGGTDGDGGGDGGAGDGGGDGGSGSGCGCRVGHPPGTLGILALVAVPVLLRRRRPRG